MILEAIDRIRHTRLMTGERSAESAPSANS